MTQQIRQKVFETNSSSSHSLVMESSQMVPAALTKAQLRDGEVSISPDDYGWEYKRLYKPLNKASYLLTYILGGAAWQTTEEACEQSPRAQMLVDAFRNRFGVALKFEPASGYVDHYATEHGVAEAVFQSQSALESFLFDESQYIQLGNDNSPAPWEMRNDKGPRELSYAHRMHAVPEGYVPLKVAIAYVATPLAKRKCVVVKALRKTLSFQLGLNTKWLNKLLQQGIVSRLDVTFHEPSYTSQRGKHWGHILEALDRLLGDHGTSPNVQLSNDVQMTHSTTSRYAKERFYEQDASMTMMVPAKLLEQFKAKVESSAKAVALALAREDLEWAKQSHKHKWEDNSLETLRAATAAYEKRASAQAKPKTKPACA